MFSLDEFKQSRLYQDIRREVLEESKDEFKQSKLYQDISEESKLEVVPALVQRGFTVEEIAEIVKLDVEKVRRAVRKLQEYVG